ncbi:hypothetical protein G7Y89_g14505 [Cudoniella acicularis]|uniref:Uncharacterized protein n=1 Tax=Cudoniella acicularis TaxID=354080 RepID=A0A8H4VVN6_9HELO|nr:hypothetical protein G7Y89_g14505 [Cudoniella acicularis]
MPAIAPPPIEELFELGEVVADKPPIIVDEIVADVICELEKELEVVADVELGVIEFNVVEVELAAPVVETSGPAFAE